MRWGGAPRAAVPVSTAVLLSVLAGCYATPSLERCAVACLAGETCPNGRACGADLHCHDVGDDTACTAMAVDAAPVVATETCAFAPVVAAPGDHVSTTVGSSNDYAGTGAGCWGSEQLLEGPDVVLSVSVPGGKRLVAGVLAEVQDAVLLLVDPASCEGPAVACLSGDDSGRAGNGEIAASPDVLTWVNPKATSKTVALIVDAHVLPPNAGPFALHLELLDPDEGDTCPQAKVLSATPGTLTWETTHGFGDDSGAVVCGENTWLAPGPERYYALTIPARETRVVTVTSGPTTGLIVGTSTNRAACLDGRLECTIGSSSGIVGGPEVVTLAAAAAATTYYLQVDGGVLSPAGSTGAYSITVSLP